MIHPTTTWFSSLFSPFDFLFAFLLSLSLPPPFTYNLNAYFWMYVHCKKREQAVAFSFSFSSPIICNVDYVCVCTEYSMHYTIHILYSPTISTLFF